MQGMRDVESSRLSAMPGVKGIAIGKKETNGKETDELSLIVFVREKKQLDKLGIDDRVPKWIDTYKTGCPFPTDVVEWPDSDADS